MAESFGILIADDHPVFRTGLRQIIDREADLEVLAECADGNEALRDIRAFRPVVAVLDIHMPDLSGTEFTRILEIRPKIIFTTAYEKYALEGFKLDAVDYLLKPFSYEEFLKAARKAERQIKLEETEKKETIEANNEFLFLKSEYKIRRINFNDIEYIEGLKDYIKVFLHNEPKPVLSLNTLKSLDAKLPPEKFMRVHRSFIVNLERIETIERSRIIFGKTYIPVSEQYKDKFQEFLNKNFL